MRSKLALGLKPSRSGRRYASTNNKAKPGSGFYNAGGLSPWFVYFQTTPNDDCMKFVIEGHEFLANMMPSDSALYKAEQRRMNPQRIVAKEPFVVARRGKLMAEAEAKRAAATSATEASDDREILVDLQSEEPYLEGEETSHFEQQLKDAGISPSFVDKKKGEIDNASTSTAASAGEKEPEKSSPANPRAASVEQRVIPMTMTFNRDNGYLSPLANTILDNIPDLIEDITIGHHFITVRRAQLDELKWKYYDDDIEGERLLKEDAEKKMVKKAQEQQQQDAMLQSEVVAEALAAAAASPSSETSEEGRMTPFMVAEAMAEITNACALPAQLHSANNNAGSASLKPERADYSTEAEESLSVDGVAENDKAKVADADADDNSGEEFREQYDPKRLEKVLPIAEAQLNWSDLQLQISSILTDHMYSRKPHVTPDAPHPHADTLPKAGDSEALLAIKELIAGTIRPLVQEDGGDLRLVKFELLESVESSSDILASEQATTTSSTTSVQGGIEGSCARVDLPAASTANEETLSDSSQRGRLHIEMLGACRSCKSSKTTLKDLIERTLQHWVPEVAEVVEVNMAKKASTLGRAQK